MIPFIRAERTNRESLSNVEMKAFLQAIRNPKYNEMRNAACAMLFFGLRPCEVDHEAKFENGFLISRNRKRKNGKIEYKKIPIPEQARGYMDFTKGIDPNCGYNKLFYTITPLLGEGKTLYSLRHTFSSACAKAHNRR